MNMKKIKRFFTMSRRHDGFTLVELIVVIAILAILGGVAVPAYGGYVKKANMTADQQLISEVKRAAILGLMEGYAHEFSGTVSIKLSPNKGAVVVSDNEADKALIETAMTKAFGEGWEDKCVLKYDGWAGNVADVTATFTSSSYYGEEGERVDSLLNKMGDLTGAMGNFFASKNPDSMPDAIKSVLKEQGVDLNNSTAMSNGAVVALAGTMTDAFEEDPTIRQNIIEAVAQGDLSLVESSLKDTYRDVYGDDSDMVTLATAATIYAAAEAFSQHCSSADTPYTRPAEILNEIEYTKTVDGVEVPLSSTQILANIISGFQQMQNETFGSAEGQAAAGTYGSMVTTDAEAFLSVLEALDESSDVLKENLESDSFYTDGSAKKLIDSYFAIGDLNLAAGEGAVVVLPSKDVTCYLGGLLS